MTCNYLHNFYSILDTTKGKKPDHENSFKTRPIISFHFYTP
jgi:hypothetical protein